MPPLENGQHERFAQAIALEGKNQTEAALIAQYSPKTAKSMGWKLTHRKPKIMARIKELQEATANEKIADKQERMEILSEVARGTLGEEAEAVQPGNVVRVKRFTVKPMSVAGAVDQMELLGHDFFLFFNDDTEELNLLYRRKNGNYGLIEPELRVSNRS